MRVSVRLGGLMLRGVAFAILGERRGGDGGGEWGFGWTKEGLRGTADWWEKRCLNRESRCPQSALHQQASAVYLGYLLDVCM